MSKLIDLIEKPLSGEWGEEDVDGTGTFVLRTTNFTNVGIISFDNVVTRLISEKKLQNKYLIEGDILIEKSGGSPTQPVGRVVYFDGEPNKYTFNNFTSVLRVKNHQKVFSRFLFYVLFDYHKVGKTKSFQNKTTGIINLKLDRYVKENDIPLPILEVQQKIAQTLDTAAELIVLRKQQLAELDDLIKSVFYEMFGDPRENTFGWRSIPLERVADITSGVTKGRKLLDKKLISVPYMRVANVQDGHLVLDEVKKIDVLESDVIKYRLMPGDLLMTEGGDPDKLGRCAVWKNEIESCIHQNHIFRVRLNQRIVTPQFSSFLIGSSYGKQYFLKAAKQTTGIATINSTQLKRFPVLLPPLSLQNQFAEIVTKIEEQKALVQKAIDESQYLFDSLMDEYFN